MRGMQPEQTIISQNLLCTGEVLLYERKKNQANVPDT